MDFELAGRVALVTASTKGIGLGIVQALAREGAKVSVVARTEADVKRVASENGGFGVAADITTEEGCRRAVDETVSNLGPVDILVNNFGARAGSSWSDTGADELLAAFNGNVVVSARMTQLVLAGMADRGIWGGLSTWEDSDGARWILAPVWGPLSNDLRPAVTNGTAGSGAIVAFKVEEQAGKPVLIATRSP